MTDFIVEGDKIPRGALQNKGWSSARRRGGSPRQRSGSFSSSPLPGNQSRSVRVPEVCDTFLPAPRLLLVNRAPGGVPCLVPLFPPVRWEHKGDAKQQKRRAGLTESPATGRILQALCQRQQVGHGTFSPSCFIEFSLRRSLLRDRAAGPIMNSVSQKLQVLFFGISPDCRYRGTRPRSTSPTFVPHFAANVLRKD